MMKRSILLFPLGAAMLLGGCGGTINRGVEPVHQPVVSRADYAFDLALGSRGLAPGERGRLAGWLATTRLGYGDSVSIDDPAANFAARDEVAAQVALYGLLIADAPPVTEAPVAPGTLRVVVTRLHAEVPGCPDFSRQYDPNYSAQTSSNYGCASNRNLALMVANPADLVRGQPGAETSDPATASKAINAYRKAASAAPSTGGK